MIVTLIKIEIPNLIDPFVIVLMGLIFEIFGTVFLSHKALGNLWFKQRFITIRKFSNWYKKSFLRMALIFICILIFLTIGIILNIKQIVVLFFPILLLVTFFSLLIDHPDFYEKWILQKTYENRLGPIGFKLIAFGVLIQIISILWQMSIK